MPVTAHTPRVGLYARSKAAEVYKPKLMWAVIVAMFFLATGGALIGFSIGRGTAVGWLSSLGLIVITSLTWWLTAYALRRSDEVLDASIKRRSSLLLGACAEVVVAHRLRDHLDATPGQWHVFDNLKLDANSDLDHVVIGPGGLFAVSTKSPRGHFVAPEGSTVCTFNGRPCDWARQAIGDSLRLRTVLGAISDDPAARVPWVQAVVALPFAKIDAPLADDASKPPIPGVGKCWVLNDDDLLNAIAPDTIPKSRKLKSTEVEGWSGALAKLHGRHA